MLVKIGNRTSESIQREEQELTIHIAGERVKTLLSVAKNAASFKLSFTASVNPYEIYVRADLRLFGFGLDLTIDISREYGYASGTAFVETPPATVHIDVIKCFRGCDRVD